MYYLPQAEGVLLHAFDNRSRRMRLAVRGVPKGALARSLPSRLPYGVALLVLEYCLRVRQC